MEFVVLIIKMLWMLVLIVFSLWLLALASTKEWNALTLVMLIGYVIWQGSPQGGLQWPVDGVSSGRTQLPPFCH